MPRTRRSKKYKRKTIKRKGGQLGKLLPGARKVAKQLGPQIVQSAFNIATGKSNLQLPHTSSPPHITYAPTHSMLFNKLKYPITQSDNKAIPIPKTPPIASEIAKVKAVARGLTTFNFTALASILITNMTAKTNAEYLTTQYIRNIISLFEEVVTAALDDIMNADVSVSEKVVKSILSDDTLSPGDIKTTLVRVLAKHLQKMAPKLKEELGKTKFVGVSPEFMTIIEPHLDALFDDLKEELSTTIIHKITNAVDNLTVDNVKEEWQIKKEKLQKEFDEKFKPAFDEFMEGSYSEKIKMLYSYSLLSYNNTMATFNEHKEPQKQAGSKPKIKITDFAKDWYSSTKELLSRWSEEKSQNPDVLTINVLISAIDLSIPTLIDEYCNYWDPSAPCNKKRIQAKFDNIMEQFREFGANYEKKDWDEFDNFKIIDEKV
jgi:hypothetical protein